VRLERPSPRLGPTFVRLKVGGRIKAHNTDLGGWLETKPACDILGLRWDVAVRQTYAVERAGTIRRSLCRGWWVKWPQRERSAELGR